MLQVSTRNSRIPFNGRRPTSTKVPPKTRRSTLELEAATVYLSRKGGERGRVIHKNVPGVAITNYDYSTKKHHGDNVRTPLKPVFD